MNEARNLNGNTISDRDTDQIKAKCFWKRFFVSNKNKKLDQRLENKVCTKLLDSEAILLNTLQNVAKKEESENTFIPKYTFKRCSSKKSKNKTSLTKICCLLILTLLCISGVVIFCFTDMFLMKIISALTIKNNTEMFEPWLNRPTKVLYKVYIFNYTNVEDVMNGVAKKLKVEEVGPYIYTESFHRVNVTFNENGTVTFQERRQYAKYFNQTAKPESEHVIVPNLSVLSLLHMVKDSYFFTQMAISTLLSSVREKAFLNLTAEEFIWGYDDTIFELAKPFLQFQNVMTSEKPGLLISNNRTSPDVYTVNTGEKDLNSINIITRINGLNMTDHWGNSECDRIDGTDGTLFPASMIDKNQTIYISNWNLCRRHPYVYGRDVESLDGMKAFRYFLSSTVFNYSNSENKCFCDETTEVCPPSGLFDNSPCAFGSPTFFSRPHFHLCESIVSDAIEGLEPDAEKHSSYIDVHPTIGLPLSGINRMQINMLVTLPTGIRNYNFLPKDAYLPVAWFEIGETLMPKEYISRLHLVDFLSTTLPLILQYIFVSLLFISGLLLIRNIAFC